MPSKVSSKNNSGVELEASIFPISVINNSRLKPYVELFSYAPANIVQLPLGNLMGFFKIGDRGDDSAYIVNFLASVVKKEYYINPRRSVSDSFDMALHKANVALSELAKNGNINWMGTLDSAVCVMEKNNFYFSVTGNARILLLREGMLTDISAGLSETEEEPHPIKTFVNVSSGVLKAEDKIIITSDSIFRIFSLAEIKKNALRFPKEKFSQFLYTALVNELDTAETLIVDFFEAAKIPKKKSQEKEEPEQSPNFFSAQVFKKDRKSGQDQVQRERKETAEFVDEKTGHIYVQGGQKTEPAESQWQIFLLALKEKTGDFYLWLKDNSKRVLISSRQKIKSFTWPKFDFKEKLSSLKTNIRSGVPKIPQPGKLSRFNFNGEKFFAYLPNFSKIKKIFLVLPRSQRWYGILVIAAIIIVPLFFIKTDENKNTPTPATSLPQEKTLREILSQDKNINLDADAQIIYSGSKIEMVKKVGDILLLAGQQKIIRLESNGESQDYSFPQDSGAAVLATPMNDLNLLFIFTEKNKIISFSPISKEFKTNGIDLPENSNVGAMGTYLTYIYTADFKQGKIYRYPRAEGGFGPGANWLKENVNLASVSDMAIDENIYLVDGSRVIKLFKGKNEPFNLEQSNTPIKPDRIFTDGDTANIYILDKINGRVVKFGKDGNIISQYYNQLLENSKDLTVDEKSNKAYLVTSDNSIVSLEL
jgi:hypothetical protein